MGVGNRKTNKAVLSRLKVSANGKVLRRKPGIGHFLAKKSAQKKRRMNSSVSLSSMHYKLYRRMPGVLSQQ